MRTLFLPITLLLASLLFFPLTTSAFSGKVIHVVDGDTITVRANGANTQIRLYGIDTPEGGQAYGNVAKKTLKRVVLGKNVDVIPKDIDQYERTVAVVLLNQQNINQMMVQNGLAWVYAKYCKETFCSNWKDLERSAKNKKIGLWREGNPTPPWKWRYQKRWGKNTTKQNIQTDINGLIHGNVKSRKFHAPGCRVYNCKNCTATFSSYEEAVAAGYKPCGICGGR